MGNNRHIQWFVLFLRLCEALFLVQNIQYKDFRMQNFWLEFFVLVEGQFSIALNTDTSDVILRDFEIFDSSTDRSNRSEGVAVYGIRHKVINLVVHDLNSGVNIWKSATNSEAYGYASITVQRSERSNYVWNFSVVEYSITATMAQVGRMFMEYTPRAASRLNFSATTSFLIRFRTISTRTEKAKLPKWTDTSLMGILSSTLVLLPRITVPRRMC